MPSAASSTRRFAIFPRPGTRADKDLPPPKERATHTTVKIGTDRSHLLNLEIWTLAQWDALGDDKPKEAGYVEEPGQWMRAKFITTG